MTATSRSALTLAVLALVLVVAGWWGWSALTEPFPETETEACQNTKVAVGDTLPRELVQVSVYNASGTAGLGGKTRSALTEVRGFSAGAAANAPAGTEAKGIQIWSSDPRNPAVELVRRQFTKATVVDRPAPSGATGVVVVVGKNPAKLKENGPESIKVTAAATVCSPSITS